MVNNTSLFNSKKDFLKATALQAMPNIVLDPTEADAFIDLVVDESYWLKNVRLERMTRNEKNIRYMDFDSTSRFLYPAAGFTSANYTKTVNEGKVTLTAHKFRGCLIIYDDDLEDNIEGQAFANHLMGLISKRIANEIDEAIYVANTTSTGFTATDIRHEFNGFRYDLLAFTRSSGDVPTAAHELEADSTGDFSIAGDIVENTTGHGEPLEIKFKNMLKALPNKYTKNYRDLRYYCNPKIMADYAGALQNRATDLGDKAIIGIPPKSFADIPIVTVPLMPSTYSSGTSGTEEFNEGTASGTFKFSDCCLSPKQNFIVGIHRSLTLELQRSGADEANFCFYSIRMTTAVQNPDAAVMLVNITNS